MPEIKEGNVFYLDVAPQSTKIYVFDTFDLCRYPPVNVQKNEHWNSVNREVRKKDS